MAKRSLNTQEFRSALGSFATGVTIVTTSHEGCPVGVTASSFNSVSLDPPLVLWSLAKQSRSLAAFRDSGHFAVHILSCFQEDLSNAFARSGEDKFKGVDWKPGALGSPVFEEFAAKFECRLVHQYEGGDHVIFVGEVVQFDKRDQSPLVFHGGNYAEARPRPKAKEAPSIEPESGRFTEDFFLYILTRAERQTSQVLWKRLAKFGLTRSQYFTLTILGMNAPLDFEDLVARVTHTGHAPTAEIIEEMIGLGLVCREDDKLVLSDRARTKFIAMLSELKAFEEDLLEQFPLGEVADAKRVLKKIIALTGGDVLSIWNTTSRT